MKNKSAFMWMLSLLFLVMLLQAAWSDVYMKQKQHNDAMTIMGQTQPAQDVISDTWLTPTKIVVSNPKQKIVLDLEKKTITMANHENKTYTTMPMDFSKAMEQSNKDMSKQDQDEMQKAMSKMMQMKMTVTATNEWKKIGSWNCRKYNQTMEMGMGTMKSEVWASPDIKIDKQLYAKYTAGMMAQMPGMGQNMEAMMKEAEKIDGVQVYASQSTEMMGQTFKSTTELLEFKEGKAPANAFDIPAGYKKAEMFQ